MRPLALSLRCLQTQPDSQLVALARDGHEAAFEALVRRYQRELLAYCRRLQPRSGSAEDALQQTLLQAWRALSAGAEVRDARPWLYRIAHNVSLNHLRVPVAVPQETPEQAGGQEVHQLVEQRLHARAALAGMAALPALQRDALVSTALKGASHEEVASALGLSPGAVRGLIYRARMTLRSAAAALIPSPVVHWAIRRADSRTGGAAVINDALVGGGGAGVAAAIAKGGAVLTLAGAVAGAGSVTFSHKSSHHRRHVARVAGPPARAQSPPLLAPVNAAYPEPATTSALRGVVSGGFSAHRRGQPGRRRGAEHRRDSDSVGEDHGGSRGGPARANDDRAGGGSGGGRSTSSGSGSEGGSRTASSGDGSSGSGSRDGGSSRSSDGGPGPSDNAPLAAAQVTSDGGSGSH